MASMAARIPHNSDPARSIDRLEERTALLRERFDDLRGEMVRGDDALRSEMNRGFSAVDLRLNDLQAMVGTLRDDMIRGDAAHEARIAKLDAKMTFFFGTLLVTILAQMALQVLR